MANFTLRIPDDRYQRLKYLAESRKKSLNSLFEEMTTLMLAEHDIETRLQLRLEQGSTKGLLNALDELDKLDFTVSK